MKRNITQGFALAFIFLLFAQASPASGRQIVDPNFDPKVARPAYTTTHPKVLFDEAHLNFQITDGIYKPFTTLITNDGYQVTPNKTKFEKQTLEGYDILVIANAMGADANRAHAAKESAFTDEECDAVRDWVRAGGSLLLMTGDMPFSVATENLGKRFSVDMSKGATIDMYNYDDEAKDNGLIIHTRESGQLPYHPIIRGRYVSERVSRIIVGMGQSLKGPPSSIALMKLEDTAFDFFPANAPEKQMVPAVGRAQGIAIELGKGRVIVLGSAKMFSTEVFKLPNRPEIRVGMNRAGIDNRQFALNVMHWLSRLL